MAGRKTCPKHGAYWTDHCWICDREAIAIMFCDKCGCNYTVEPGKKHPPCVHYESESSA